MRLVFDIEADGLYWDVTEVYCLVAYDIDTKKTYKFTADSIRSTIEEGVKFVFKADTLIGHNITTYDIPVIEKLYNIKFTGIIVISQIYDFFLQREKRKVWN